MTKFLAGASLCLVLGVLATGCRSQGEYEPHEFLWLAGAWERTDYDHKEGLFFAEDLRFLWEERTRQVGKEGDRDLPYPTTCQYRRYGRDLIFSGASDHAYRHEVSFRVTGIQLSNQKQDPACLVFLARTREHIRTDRVYGAIQFGAEQFEELRTDDGVFQRAEPTYAGLCPQENTLEARTFADDYGAATLSMRYAAVRDNEQVNNDWELLFGNDRFPEVDTLSVNTVTDDHSWIVDLGEIDLDQAPARVDFEAFPTGYWGKHDDIAVEVGHVYYVRSRDSDMKQVSLVQVVAHDLNRSVTVRWVRSADPDQFVWGCKPSD